MLERSFFEQVLDAFEGFVADDTTPVHARAHRRGVKAWFGSLTETPREHYEAQLVRIDGDVKLEIGFHAEHPDEARNEQTVTDLDAAGSWRDDLGDAPEIGPFVGNDGWRRISELWEPPDPDDPEAPIEIAARLTDYALAFEPLRAGVDR